MCVPFSDRCCYVAQDGRDLPVLLPLLLEAWDFKACATRPGGAVVAKQRKPVATTATLSLPLAHLYVPYSSFASCSKSAFFCQLFSCP